MNEQSQAPEALPGSIRGKVLLEGQALHAGTEVSASFLSSAVDSWTPLAAPVLLALLLLLFRRRRALGLLAGLAFGATAGAALQVLSAPDGAYELTPDSGGLFAPGAYRVDFRHAGYLPESRLVRVGEQSGSVVDLPDVTLRRACTVFPEDNPWNTDISGYPVHPNSEAYIGFIGAEKNLHPDFGTFWEGAPIGIPYVVVSSSQPKSSVEFLYADESDRQGYPIPEEPPIEGGPDGTGDRHILMLDLEACLLYELYWAWPPGVGQNPYTDRWYAGSGAIFDLKSNALRPEGWTSADAAGLSIYPGLVRYDEVVGQGRIEHALRFTVRSTQRGYIHPATHFASDSTDPARPPMGLRVRLKASYDCGGYSAEAQVVCVALKRYGMFVADNGSDWYISGAHDPRWDDDRLGDLKQIPGAAFEAVDTGPILSR